MTKKKTASKKKSRPSARAAEPDEPAEPREPAGDGEEVLTKEELLERLRKARAAKAGVVYRQPRSRLNKKGPVKLVIPPFDPNLPPAAFPSLPTIGQPIPTGTREGHLRRVKEDRERRLQGLEPLPRESYHPGPLFRISGHDDAPNANEPTAQQPVIEKPLDVSAFNAEYEAPKEVNVDCEASNTALNGVYMRNMAQLAEADGLDLANRLDMDWSESENEKEQFASVPDWNQLPLSLQAEIIDNLSEQSTRKDTMDMLGLTHKQENEAMKILGKFHKTIDHTAQELKKMRERQLHALLSLDNSRDDNVPAEHILNRISRNSLNNIVQGSNKEFLKCKIKDLRAAWQFLDGRGLPRELAGDWDDGIETIRPDKDDEHAAKRVKRSHPRATTEGPLVMPINARPPKQLSLAENVAVINNVGQGKSISSSMALSVDVEHPMQALQKHWDEWEQLFTDPDKNEDHLDRDRRLLLALDQEGAAAVMAIKDAPALPEPRVAQYRYNQRIERVKLDAEAEKRDANDSFAFMARDVTARSWEQKLEDRYQKLANDCQKLFLSYDSRDDVEYEENSELDEKELDELLVEASQSNEELRGLLEDGSSS